MRFTKAISKKAKNLITGGVNAEAEDPLSGMHPIHLAASLGDIDVIDLLLKEKNIRADTIDRRGKAPYEWAQEYKQAKTEMFLLNEIFNNPERYGKTSVELAKMHLSLAAEPA